MATTGVASTSSSFATLLKQSKFASYSPAIAQVYTTYGGHAFRGDWGVKRPLSVRKSGRALLIQSIDSPQQQTEFRSGEPESKMVKRWNETGVHVGLAEEGEDNRSWSLHYTSRRRSLLEIDSEFSTHNAEPDPLAGPAGQNLALGVRTPPSTEATPNIYTMSQREFNKYLEKMRKLRPAFRKYIQEKEATFLRRENQGERQARKQLGLFYMRKRSGNNDMADDFINEMAYQLHGDPNSQALEPYPHRNGGLFYPHHTDFQTNLLYDPIQSHVTPVYGRITGSAAGVPVRLSNVLNSKVTTVDWERENTTAGVASVRIIRAGLNNPPETVTTLRSPASKLSYSAPAASILRRKNLDFTTPPFTYPQGLKSVSISVGGVPTQDTKKWRAGSIQYSLSMPERMTTKSGPKPPPQANTVTNFARQSRKGAGAKIQAGLISLLDKMKASDVGSTAKEDEKD
ncbi:hypothetical protein FRC17_009677 [Serendipita sp. 399]|nr:hypothetical protein FRC17_009677 [Serendipita sp. 399]